MAKITVWLPVHAQAKFEFEKPENWEHLSENEKEEYAYDYSRRVGSICHYCAKSFQSDFEVIIVDSLEFDEC